MCLGSIIQPTATHATIFASATLCLQTPKVCDTGCILSDEKKDCHSGLDFFNSYSPEGFTGVGEPVPAMEDGSTGLDPGKTQTTRCTRLILEDTMTTLRYIPM